MKIKNDNTNNVIGWCLEPHDLIVSKLYAGREKDIDFVSVAINVDIVDVNLIRSRIMMVSNHDHIRQVVIERLNRILLDLKKVAKEGINK